MQNFSLPPIVVKTWSFCTRRRQVFASWKSTRFRRSTIFRSRDTSKEKSEMTLGHQRAKFLLIGRYDDIAAQWIPSSRIWRHQTSGRRCNIHCRVRLPNDSVLLFRGLRLRTSEFRPRPYLSERLATLLGGELKVASEYGKGSPFNQSLGRG